MIIYRSFVREVVLNASAVAGILLSILLVTRVVYFLRQAAEGDIPIGNVAQLGVLKVITHLDILIPLAVYIAIVLVITRWARDNELTVVSACGMSMIGFLRPAFGLFLGVGSLVALLSLYLSPLSAEIAHIQEQQIRNHPDVFGVLPGVFNKTRDGRGTIFVERYDKATGTFHEVFVYTRLGAGSQVVVSNTGVRMMDEASGEEFLVLQDGTLYRGQAGKPSYGVLNFSTYGISLKKRTLVDSTLPYKARHTEDLIANGEPTVVGQLHWRLSKVAMVPVLILFALVFSSIRPRVAHLSSMMMALGVYFIYFNCLGVALTMVTRGIANPYQSLWAVHIFFLLLAIFFFFRRNQNLPLYSMTLKRT